MTTSTSLHAVLRLAAFTDNPDGGNPAGVVIGDTLPTDTEMQSLAARVGYSETAFLAPAGEGHRDWTVRYFAPEAEVDFCGHATIASGVALAQRFGPGRFTLQTNVGPVAVDTSVDGGKPRAALTSVEPSIAPLSDAALDDLLAHFGWTRAVLDPQHTPAVAFGGVHHPVLVLDDPEAFTSMTYDFATLRAQMEAEGWTTIQVVLPQGQDRFRSRNPFPIGGVVEDPATGAAAAAFGGWLRATGAVRAPATVTLAQGVEMGRPSTLTVRIPEAGGITVEGTAVPIS